MDFLRDVGNDKNLTPEQKRKKIKEYRQTRRTENKQYREDMREKRKARREEFRQKRQQGTPDDR